MSDICGSEDMGLRVGRSDISVEENIGVEQAPKNHLAPTPIAKALMDAGLLPEFTRTIVIRSGIDDVETITFECLLGGKVRKALLAAGIDYIQT